jgi:hypothetical protein
LVRAAAYDATRARYTAKKIRQTATMGNTQELFRDPSGSISAPAADDVYSLTPAVLCDGRATAGRVKVNIIKLDTLPDDCKLRVRVVPCVGWLLSSQL